MTGYEAPKRIRRFQAQSGYSGHIRFGLMHAGKFRMNTHPLYGGYKDWTPACYSDEQLREKSRGNLPGRALTAGAKAPITCPRCIAMLKAGEL